MADTSLETLCGEVADHLQRVADAIRNSTTAEELLELSDILGTNQELTIRLARVALLDKE